MITVGVMLQTFALSTADQCVQYPDLCDPRIVMAWWKPAQAQYIDLYNSARGANGGFFHQCFLGSCETKT